MSIEEMVREIYTRGAVKGIQRIAFSGTATDTAYRSYYVAISPVNTNKAFVRTTWEQRSRASSTTSDVFKVSLFSEGLLLFELYNQALCNVSLEVIEFY